MKSSQTCIMRSRISWESSLRAALPSCVIMIVSGSSWRRGSRRSADALLPQHGPSPTRASSPSLISREHSGGSGRRSKGGAADLFFDPPPGRSLSAADLLLDPPSGRSNRSPLPRTTSAATGRAAGPSGRLLSSSATPSPLLRLVASAALILALFTSESFFPPRCKPPSPLWQTLPLGGAPPSLPLGAPPSLPLGGAPPFLPARLSGLLKLTVCLLPLRPSSGILERRDLAMERSFWKCSLIL